MENNLGELIAGLIAAITGLITYFIRKKKRKNK